LQVVGGRGRTYLCCLEGLGLLHPLA
jgi:hypothetical protein